MTYHHSPTPLDTTSRNTVGLAVVPAEPAMVAGTVEDVDMYALYDTTAATLRPVLTRAEPAVTE